MYKTLYSFTVIICILFVVLFSLREPSKKVGIVSMYPNPIYSKHVINAVIDSGNEYELYDINKEKDILKIIKTSHIKKWIFTGSQNNVKNPRVPRVPIEILDLQGKEFFLICYSMESVLNTLGYPLYERNENKKENFFLNINFDKEPYTIRLFDKLQKTIYVQRNHKWYTTIKPDQHPTNVISMYNKETMMVLYKNAVMTQFHPEKTPDGKQLLHNWTLF